MPDRGDQWRLRERRAALRQLCKFQGKIELYGTRERGRTARGPDGSVKSGLRKGTSHCRRSAANGRSCWQIREGPGGL
jgi:hypothetical protein